MYFSWSSIDGKERRYLYQNDVNQLVDWCLTTGLLHLGRVLVLVTPMLKREPLSYTSPLGVEGLSCTIASPTLKTGNRGV